MRECFDKILNADEVRSLLLFSELICDHPEELRRRIGNGFEVELVKRNPKRRVFRLSCPDGSSLYLKLFAHQNFIQRRLYFYAENEYAAARKLEKLDLPVIRYLAWGYLKDGGFCLSEGIPEAVSCRRWFFESLIHQPAEQAEFIDLLSDLTSQLFARRIRHPDYHLGNILFSSKTRQLYLPDPWGVHPLLFGFRSKRQRIELCHPWLEIRGSVPESQLLEGIQLSGLSSSADEAEKLLDETAALHAGRLRRHRKKMDQRILSGKSKFATEIVLPEGKCAFRHTEWFEPPAVLQLSPDWHRVEYKSELESRAAWLDSFLLIPPMNNPPLARLIRDDGSSVLFFADSPKHS